MINSIVFFRIKFYYLKNKSKNMNICVLCLKYITTRVKLPSLNQTQKTKKLPSLKEMKLKKQTTKK